METSPAYLNGRWVTQADLQIPFYDAGFVLGATVTEQLRTFAGELYQLDDHIRRLIHSLEVVGIEPQESAQQLADIACEAVTRNWSTVPAGSDLGLGIFITPGPYSTLAPSGPRQPTVCVHTYRLPFEFWATRYDEGQPVVVTDVRQVPTVCWPADLKCRSRMHYYLADREAEQRQPGARAVLLDTDGNVSEASTASVMMYRANEGLVAPIGEKILPSISRMVLKSLAGQEGIPVIERDIAGDELASADEVMLASTTVCMLPVLQVDGLQVGTGRPGPVYRKLLDAWSRSVGLNIPEQAFRFGI